MNQPSSYTVNDSRWFSGSRGITTDDVVLIGAVRYLDANTPSSVGCIPKGD